MCMIYNSKEQALSFELNTKLLDFKISNIPNCDDNGGLYWCIGHNFGHMKASVLPC